MQRALIRLGISGLVFIVFFLHSSGWVPYRFLDTIERFTYDARVLLTLPNTTDKRVVILDIDEKSLAAEGQWPWARDKLARLVTQLFDQYHILVLGFDIAFAEPDKRSGLDLLDNLSKNQLADLPGFAERVAGMREQLDYDRVFAEAIKGKPVVLGVFLKSYVPKDEQARTGAICAPLLDSATAKLYSVDFTKAQGYGGNVDVLQSATPYCGFFDNPKVDDDGVFRRVPLVQQFEGAVYPSLALALTRAALGIPEIQFEFEPPDRRTSLNLERLRLGPVFAPVDGDVAAYVPYRGHYHTFTYVSATDVLHGTANPEVLKGTIVIMGTSAAGLLDLRTTPMDKAYAGVEVHANLVSGLLDGSVKQKAPYYIGIETFMLVVIAVLLAWVFPRLTPLGSASVALGMLVAIVVLSLVMWQYANFIMPMGMPIVFTLTLFLAHLLYGYFIEARRSRDISKMFGEYVPPQIVSEMAERGGSVSMEGEEREMTVLFSDVRGFTSISEMLPAKELSDMMNQFLTPQTKAIHKYRGTVDKYMGDAIMAFWGAPLLDNEHGFHALQAGLEMLRIVRELDSAFEARGWPKINIGVGINSGKMRVGNMGSEFRRAYTVMGDPVNLGSRVEGLTKEYGSAIICTEYTRNTAPSDWSFRELDLVRVKGKNEPVAIYEPLGPKDALESNLRQDLARHRGALKLYRAQQWDQAEAEFFNLSRSGRPHHVYELFLERIAYLRAHLPAKDWDGAFTFKTK